MPHLEMYRYKFPRREGKPPLLVMKLKEYGNDVEYYDPEAEEINRRDKLEFERLFEPLKK